ncbi:MAG: type II secretion system F family protein [Roseburia sp.]|nr:type II secretion system F family protein [Roseburia sp.]
MGTSSGRQDYHSYRFTGGELLQMVCRSVGVVLLLAGFFYQSLWAVLPLSVTGFLYAEMERRKRNEKRRQELTGQFKECILSVSASLQAGYAIENAFLESREDMRSLYGEPSLIYQELEYIRRGLVINITLEEQLLDLAQRSSCEDIEQFARIFSIAKRSGGNLAEIIRASANLISQRVDTRQEIQVLLSGKKMEQKIMRLMPFGILLYIGSSYPGYFRPLYHNLQGAAVMSLCLVLYLAAYILGDKILMGIDREISGAGKPGNPRAPTPAGRGLLGGISNLCRGLYRRSLNRGIGCFISADVALDLKKLYPAEDGKQIQENYYTAKLSLCVITLFAGLFLALAVHIRAGLSGGGEDNSLLLAGISLVVSIAFYFLKDKDLHDELAKRKKFLKLQYPDIVYKLVLYLGAGMSVRGCFGKLSEDYELMLYACRELQTGMSEAAVYDRLGKRSGLQEYIRLSTLLSQNLKKGNSTLLLRLDEEAYKASRERVQTARRLGEEAGTKLLIPMVMFLAVVMLMIAIPAFTGLEL